MTATCGNRRATADLGRGPLPRCQVTSGLLGINESTIPALEASYHAFLAELSSHLDRHQFLLGDRPSLGDFGFAAPLYAHLGRDPLPHYQVQSSTQPPCSRRAAAAQAPRKRLPGSPPSAHPPPDRVHVTAR